MRRELLSPAQMGQCDALTIAAGTPGTVLMERAGEAVAERARELLPKNGRVAVLAGPGNNGGDGYVAARHLKDAGCTVALFALGDLGNLSGDAHWAFEHWGKEVLPSARFSENHALEADLIIDALFGAGLTRALDGEAARLVSMANASGTPVLAVDLPSGLDGASGQPLGPAVQAKQTITFHALKPGHVLLPGRALCGAISVADIGILEEAAQEAGFTAQLTGPYLTEGVLNVPPHAHKYGRGHALVVCGPPEKAGAGFLAASAALRCSAGLVTLAAPQTVLDGSVGLYPALMRAPCESAQDLAHLLTNPKIHACALGPGLPPDEAARQMVYAALDSAATLVLDAGALSAFSGMADPLFEAIKTREATVVLTPHEGEFARLFGALDGRSKIEVTQKAAQLSGAVVVHKGTDTVIAGPHTMPYVNASAPPWLATAGSGDVLTGILAGLLAGSKSNDLSKTAALGVWLHGAAAREVGPALVASDLEPALRAVLQSLQPHDFKPLEAG